MIVSRQNGRRPKYLFTFLGIKREGPQFGGLKFRQGDVIRKLYGTLRFSLVKIAYRDEKKLVLLY